MRLHPTLFTDWSPISFGAGSFGLAQAAERLIRCR
jgi:hypothetical protein